MKNLSLVGLNRPCLLFFLLPFVLYGQGAKPSTVAAPQNSTEISSALYVKVQLDGPVKLSTLKPGDVVGGKLSRSVYANDRLLFPAGSRVRLTVDKLEVRRKAPNDHWS